MCIMVGDWTIPESQTVSNEEKLRIILSYALMYTKVRWRLKYNGKYDMWEICLDEKTLRPYGPNSSPKYYTVWNRVIKALEDGGVQADLYSEGDELT